jgi:hypothetical protein
MPTWTTHREGGSWSGGGTQVRDCSSTQQTRITNAYNNFISDNCLDCFPGLEDCIRGKWASIEIDCTDPDCSGLDGRQSGNKILICNTSTTRVGPVLLHELVHACGGTELDSEAVEHHCFNGNGATLPTSGDWDKFKSETSSYHGNDNERVGKYVIWNSDTGEVWGKKSDGTKGNRCFQSNNWRHSYPSTSWV